MSCERQKAIDEFLRTDGYDPCHFVWPGDALERCRFAERELRRTVLREVQRRSKGRTHPQMPDMDDRAFTRAKLKDRRLLFDEFRAGFKLTDDWFDPAELLDILEEAVNARHGWKRILARCSPAKPDLNS